MKDNRIDSTELWYAASAKNKMIFVLVWLVASVPTLIFLRWIFHSTAALYLFMLQWVLFGLMMVARPKWVIRMRQAIDKRMERDMERLDKYKWPGFP